MMRKKVVYLILFLFFFSVSAMGQEKSYFNQTELGLIWGKGQKNWEDNYIGRTSLSINTFHGTYINRHQVVGFSVGLDQYEQIQLIPLAMGWRGFLGKKSKPNLFAGLDIGRATAILEKKEVTEWSSNWYEGGIMINPSIGIKLPAKNGKWNLSSSLGYKRQEAAYNQGFLDNSSNQRSSSQEKLPPGFNSLNETTYLFHSLVFKMGVMF
jgi:hypothetical protein